MREEERRDVPKLVNRKPCPKCLSIRTTMFSMSDRFKSLSVMCLDCGFRNGSSDTEEKAEKAWNESFMSEYSGKLDVDRFVQKWRSRFEANVKNSSGVNICELFADHLIRALREWSGIVDG